MKFKVLVVLCVLFTLMSIPTLRLQAAEDGLVAWFTFNETDGNIAHNEIPSQDGVHQNGPVPVEAKLGYGLRLDGVTEYVTAPNHANFNMGTGDFTFTAWIKTADGNGNIISKRINRGSTGYLFMVYSGRLLLQMSDDVYGWYNFIDFDSPAVNDNQWHHVAVSVDRDNIAGGNMYIDGELVYTFNPVRRSGNLDSPADLWMGQEGGGGEYFAGILDDVRIYKKALSGKEINGVMNPVTHNVADFSVLAVNSIYMRTGAVVAGGNVGVVNTVDGPYLNDPAGAELSLSSNVQFGDNVSIYADTVKIEVDSSVDNVYCNQLNNKGTLRGELVSPLPLPLDITLPAFPSPQPGSETIHLGDYETMTLAPGAYGDVALGVKAVLILSGGTYHFNDVALGDYAELRCETGTRMVIANRLASGKKVKIGPTADALIDAGDIVVYVNGIDGTTGVLGDMPRAAVIGIRNTIQANIYAPNGTLWLKARGTAEGAFIGKDVMVEFYEIITLNSAF